LCAAPSSDVLIKRAEPSDADALRELFDIRSGTEEGTASDASGLELGKPGRMVWVASQGRQAIGMTGVLVRRLSVGHHEIAVASWTAHFIDPAYRSALLYPRLLSAMFNGVREAGLTTLYAAVRRRQVADAHLWGGLKKLGDLPVLTKPLRPVQFLAKYTKILRNGRAGTCVQAVCRVPDALFAWGMRLAGPRVQGPWRVREGTWSGSTVTGLAELYESDGMIQTGQHWTVDMLLARYGSAPHEYRVMEVRLLRRRGYLASSEPYSLLLWTDPRAETPRFPMDPHRWRFSFADHDTF